MHFSRPLAAAQSLSANLDPKCTVQSHFPAAIGHALTMVGWLAHCLYFTFLLINNSTVGC